MPMANIYILGPNLKRPVITQASSRTHWEVDCKKGPIMFVISNF